MPLAVFEHEISASRRPQTHALDRVATGIGAQLKVRYAQCNRIPGHSVHILIKWLTATCTDEERIIPQGMVHRLRCHS
jgi:hypothetical protein